jgi:hypothetical protein
MSTQASATRSQIVKAMAICACAYLYVFPYYPKINNPNENVRFYMTAAIVEYGTYEIDALRARWGWVEDAAIHDGHVYSVKAPGTSLLGVPGYAAYRYGTKLLNMEFDRTTALWICRLTASILPSLLFLYFFYIWLSRQTRHPLLRNAVFFSVALGSLLYGYALLFVSHTLSAAVAFGAFMILYDSRRNPSNATSHGKAFLAGLLAAAVTFFEYPGLVASFVLSIFALFALRPLSRLVSFAVGGLIPTLAMMHFQASAFGSPFTPGHLFVEDASFRSAHLKGIYGAVGPTKEALYGLLIDPAAGLFPLTPIMAFGLFGFYIIMRDRKERLDAWIALSITLLTFLVICSMNNWRGGWTIGPRYLAVIVPFMAWSALRCLDRMADRAPRVAFSLALGSTVVALVASGIPAVYYPHIPPEFVLPLSQLFSILIAHDYAPHNAGNLINVFGTQSMLPLAVVFVAAIVSCINAVYGVVEKSKLVAGSAIVAACFLGPLMIRLESEPEIRAAVAFVTHHWSPEGHDRASRLLDKLRTSPSTASDEKNQLIDVLQVEGRNGEAKRIETGHPDIRRSR